jgi:hypothetical protein
MNDFVSKRPKQYRDNLFIQPGVVGSVGDVLGQVRYKHSAPDLPLRFDPHFAGKNEIFLGANVSDGQKVGYCSGGGPARLLDSNWESARSFRKCEGWLIQDLRAPDDRVEPFVGSTFDYSWRNKIATVYEAKRTGENFLPLPGGYQLEPGEQARGGSGPRVTDITPGELTPGGESVVVGGVEHLQQSYGYPIPVVSRHIETNLNNVRMAAKMK